MTRSYPFHDGGPVCLFPCRYDIIDSLSAGGSRQYFRDNFYTTFSCVEIFLTH